MENDGPDINKILGNALLLGFEKITKRTLDSIKKVWLKSSFRYGFTPEPEEATKLKRISQNNIYQTFKEIIGKYKFTPYIKVGILLYELNKIGDKDRVEEIRKDVYNSRDGYIAKKIIHLASTGTLLHVLNFLIDLKNSEDLSQYAIQTEFEKILNLWRKVSVPVSNKAPEAELVSRIKDVIRLKEDVVIIYGCGHAAEKAQILIAKLIKENFFSENNYLPWSKNNVFYGVLHYVCLAYYIEKGFSTPLSS